MLQIILDSGHYAMQDPQFESPLFVALQHNCFASLRIFDKGGYDFDYQMIDQHGHSFIGFVMKQLDDMPDENSSEYKKLSDFLKDILSKTDLDMHKE